MKKQTEYIAFALHLNTYASQVNLNVIVIVLLYLTQ